MRQIRAAEPNAVDPILILGAPRSGTTWLAKIFDSHPDVLYLHEPDTVLRNSALPVICRRSDIARYRSVAYEYVQQLITTQTLKTVGSLPIFAKTYRSRAAHCARTAIIFAVHAFGQITRRANAGARVAIPEMADRAVDRPVRTVIKSVTLRGSAGVFAAALPHSHFVFIVRHPCGQIASWARGFTTGRFLIKLTLKKSLIEEILATDGAEQHGLDSVCLHSMSEIELLAWHWGLFNQKVVDDVADGARLHVVSYERLCERPIETARNLFDAVGLAWDRRAVSFIGKSTTYHGPYRYYGIRQNTQAVKEKWRHELDTGDQLRIMAIAQRFPIGRFICDAEEWGRDPTQVMKVG